MVDKVIEKLPEHIVTAIRMNYGLDADDSSQDEVIFSKSPDEQFKMFCEWHGLIGWSKTLSESLDSIRVANVFACILKRRQDNEDRQDV